MTNLNPVSGTPDLPDDPRDCCRAILDTFDAVAEYPLTKAPVAYARMSEAMLEGDVDLSECRESLLILAHQAAEAAEAYHAAVQRAWKLARHGTGEHRAGDAICAAQKRISGAGGDPPNWLNWQWPDIVHKRMQQAAEAGETLFEAEAVERLVAEGPPPPAPDQKRLGDLLHTIGKLNADQEERLLATARELAEEPDAA